MKSCFMLILLLTTQVINQLVESQKIDSNNLRVFYQRMLNLLDRENWLEITSNIDTTVTAVSENCTNSFNRFNTTNSTGLLFDSFAKPPPGILTGNLRWLGNWDECLSLPRTRYITLTIPLSINGLSQMLSVDICLPMECDNHTDIIGLINNLQPQPTFNASKIETYTHVPFQITSGRIATIVLFVTFGILIAISTLVDFVARLVRGFQSLYTINHDAYSPIAEVASSSTCVRGGMSTSDSKQKSDEYTSLIEPPIHSLGIRRRVGNTINKLTGPFSLYTNVKKVFNTNQPPSAILCINGIRTISLFWVIMGHAYVISYKIFPNTQFILEKIAPTFSFQAVLNGYFSADSFFVLSGLLVMYLSLRQLDRTKKTKLGYLLFFIKFYLHRILRISPTFVILLLFYWQISPLLSDGPLWRPGVDKWVDSCDNFGWIPPILYLNNIYSIVDAQIGCMGWTWYLANDMQFFLISPIFIIPAFAFKFPFALIPLFVAIILFLIPPMVITAVYSLHSNLYFPLNHLTDGLFEVASNMTYVDPNVYYYVKPYCRINPYLVGMALGYIIWKVNQWKSQTGDRRALKLRLTILSTISWPVSFTLCFALVYGLYSSFHGHLMSEFENILYLGLSRTLWGLGLSLLIFICYSGMGGPIDTFLSWGVFVPLSRLTFTAYLIHPIVISASLSSLRYTLVYEDTSFVYMIVGLVTLSYGAAAVFAVCIEFPLANIEEMLLKRKKNKY